MNKIWRYIYIDQTIVETEIVDGVEKKRYTATNRNLFQNCPITYNVPEGLCYIHSDEAIVGLTLFMENSGMIESVVV
jgi:uncharacterized membrane-anchored protein